MVPQATNGEYGYSDKPLDATRYEVTYVSPRLRADATATTITASKPKSSVSTNSPSGAQRNWQTAKAILHSR